MTIFQPTIVVVGHGYFLKEQPMGFSDQLLAGWERGVKAILRFLVRTPGPQRKILERRGSGKKIRSSFFFFNMLSLKSLLNIQVVIYIGNQT